MKRADFLELKAETKMHSGDFEYAKANHTLKMVAYLKGKYQFYNGETKQARRTWYGFPTYWNPYKNGVRHSSKMELKKLINHYMKKPEDYSIAIIYTNEGHEVMRFKGGNMYKVCKHSFISDSDGNDIITLG